MKEVVRVHTEPVPVSPISNSSTSSRKICSAPRVTAMRRHSPASAPCAADAGSAERPLQLADAQLTLAREAGFDSWPKLVADFHERDFTAFAQAVQAGDTARVRQQLALEHVRARVNDPTFAFGQRAAHIAAKNEPLLDGASRRRRRRQPEERVGERPLHRARQRRRARRPGSCSRAAPRSRRTSRPGSAGSTSSQALVDADAALVHARGGDGQQPLHAGEDGRDCRLPARSRRRHRRALHRSQDHAGAVRAGRSPGRLPAPARARGHARHLHGRLLGRRRARHPPGGRRPRPASRPASTSPAMRRSRRCTSTAGRSGSACRRTTRP